MNHVAAATDSETQAIAAQAVALGMEVEALRIEGPASLQLADNMLVAIAEKTKEVDKRRRFFVDPLNGHVRAINAFFKKLLGPIENADQVLRRKVLEYRRVQAERIAEERRKAEEQAREEERKAREARAAADAAARAGLPKAAEACNAHAAEAQRAANQSIIQASIAAVQAPKTTRPAQGGMVSSRKVWKFDVTEPLKVPREYLSVDTRALGDAVRRGVRLVPGVRIYEDEEVYVTRGRS